MSILRNSFFSRKPNVIWGRGVFIAIGNGGNIEVKSLIVILFCFVFTIFGVVVCHELWEIALWAPVVVFVIFILTNYYVCRYNSVTNVI